MAVRPLRPLPAPPRPRRSLVRNWRAEFVKRPTAPARPASGSLTPHLVLPTPFRLPSAVLLVSSLPLPAKSPVMCRRFPATRHPATLPQLAGTCCPLPHCRRSYPAQAAPPALSPRPHAANEGL